MALVSSSCRTRSAPDHSLSRFRIKAGLTGMPLRKLMISAKSFLQAASVLHEIVGSSGKAPQRARQLRIAMFVLFHRRYRRSKDRDDLQSIGPSFPASTALLNPIDGFTKSRGMNLRPVPFLAPPSSSCSHLHPSPFRSEIVRFLGTSTRTRPCLFISTTATSRRSAGASRRPVTSAEPPEQFQGNLARTVTLEPPPFAASRR